MIMDTPIRVKAKVYSLIKGFGSLWARRGLRGFSGRFFELTVNPKKLETGLGTKKRWDALYITLKELRLLGFQLLGSYSRILGWRDPRTGIVSSRAILSSSSILGLSSLGTYTFEARSESSPTKTKAIHAQNPKP